MIASRYVEILIVLVGSLIAIILGCQIVTFTVQELFVLAFFIFLGAWTLAAGDYWWVLVPSGATILGVFKVGIKIYPLELALALAILGLVPLVLVRSEKVLQKQREPLPFVFYAAAIYITVRFMVDIVPAGHGERGNLLRIYFDAIWPFIFGFLFHHYGKTSPTIVAVILVFVLLSLRTIASLVGYFLDIPLYIPGINYVLSFSSEDSLGALRAVALTLLTVSAIFFHRTRSNAYKLMLLPVFIVGTLLVVMGGSRFSTLMVLIMPVCFFAWSRRWILLGGAGVFVVGVVGFVNVFPDSLFSLPPIANRALSGLVIEDKNEKVHLYSASDEWHEALRVEGFRRWTTTPLTILFGYGVVPSPELFETKNFIEDPQGVVEIAANGGAYECALWTVVGVLGLVGAGLYFLLFIYFWEHTFPYFLAYPTGTFREGMLFWGCYGSVMWFVTSYWQGGFPSLELVMIIIAMDLIQDGKPKRIELKTEPLQSAYGLAPRLVK